jgi:DNA-binding response OmpR family regulator/REP element-mobilizing transposase RayT
MGIAILVVDANAEYGKLIQKTLEETGVYQVALATRAIEALMRFTEANFQAVILDFDLPDLNGPDLIRQMRGINDKIPIIGVIDEEKPKPANIEGLSIDIVLDKPAYLTDLPAILSSLLKVPSQPPTPKREEQEVQKIEEQPQQAKSKISSSWMEDPQQAGEHLTRLTQEHSTHAMLLSRGNKPWSYSQGINESQALGLVQLISEHSERMQAKGALVRYIRLSGNDNDFLLYATPLAKDLILTLIFSMDTPFSTARRQAYEISQMLIKLDSESASAHDEAPIVEKLVAVSQDVDEPIMPSDWIPTPSAPVQSMPTELKTETVVSEEKPLEGEVEGQIVMPSITSVPKIPHLPNDWVPKMPQSSDHLPFLNQEQMPPVKVESPQVVDVSQQEPKYFLPFTAVLLPRFPRHTLVGSLSNQLESWVKDLCIAWGWRADSIDVRPDLLRFTVSLSPEVAPAQAVQSLAQNLSTRILKAFPTLSEELPSGQFWTKRYLLTAGSDVGKDRLSHFIEATRKDQGLTN